MSAVQLNGLLSNLSKFNVPKVWAGAEWYLNCSDRSLKVVEIDHETIKYVFEVNKKPYLVKILKIISYFTALPYFVSLGISFHYRKKYQFKECFATDLNVAGKTENIFKNKVSQVEEANVPLVNPAVDKLSVDRSQLHNDENQGGFNQSQTEELFEPDTCYQIFSTDPNHDEVKVSGNNQFEILTNSNELDLKDLPVKTGPVDTCNGRHVTFENDIKTVETVAHLSDNDSKAFNVKNWPVNKFDGTLLTDQIQSKITDMIDCLKDLLKEDKDHSIEMQKNLISSFIKTYEICYYKTFEIENENDDFAKLAIETNCKTAALNEEILDIGLDIAEKSLIIAFPDIGNPPEVFKEDNLSEGAQYLKTCWERCLSKKSYSLTSQNLTSQSAENNNDRDRSGSTVSTDFVFV
ncbi:MAG: hypothetical protein JHC93_08025 [Parachlamydiales bacterium]|nr:hypothetical protein [Parachlamydiales bacterium]